MHWFDELAEEKENHQHTYKAVLEVLYESTPRSSYRRLKYTGRC
ncbi:MAG: hypothetical protein ABSG56_10725 [Bryobacteraceae bacterium]